MNRAEITDADATERERVGQGFSAGIFGAVVMGLSLMIVSSMRDTGFFTPMQLVGATLLGGDWMQAPVWSAILGTVLHLGVGAGLGALFAAMARDVDGFATRLAAGLAFGAGVFMVMTFLVLPWANPVMYYTIDKGVFFLCHLAFGATMPIALMRSHPLAVDRTHHAGARR